MYVIKRTPGGPGLLFFGPDGGQIASIHVAHVTQAKQATTKLVVEAIPTITVLRQEADDKRRADSLTAAPAQRTARLLFTQSFGCAGLRQHYPDHAARLDIEADELLAKIRGVRGRPHSGLLVCGNGGSACNAAHLTEDLQTQLRGSLHLPTVCLNDSVGALTALANDHSYEEVFSRQLSRVFPTDTELTVLLLSTSGTSKNILAAATAAKQQRCTVLGVTAYKSPLYDMADVALGFPAAVTTPQQEELQLVLTHWLINDLNR